MALVITADRPDELPEALRAIAKEVAGKFVVGELPQGFALENVQGLKNALAEEKAGRKAAEKRASLIEGLADEDVPAAKSALEQQKAGTLKSAKEIEDYRKALEEKGSAEVRKVQDKLSKREAQLRKQMVDTEWTKHLVEAGFGDALRLVLPICRDASQVEEDQSTGELKVVLRDAHGRPLISKKSGNNDDMNQAEFVAQLREQPDLKPLCKSKAAGGSGAGSQHGGSAPAAGIDITKMSPADLIAMGSK